MPYRIRGFTLLELMTAVAVLGVLLGIGVPAFSNLMRNNQIAAESNNLLVALTLARSEALKRGVRVSVCPAQTPGADTCGTAAQWGNGWVVFEDDFGGAGSIEAGDVIVQRSEPSANGVGFDTATASVTFTRTGRPESLLAQQFRVSKAGCIQDQLRVVTVDPSGRVGLRREACPE